MFLDLPKSVEHQAGGMPNLPENASEITKNVEILMCALARNAPQREANDHDAICTISDGTLKIKSLNASHLLCIAN